MPTKKKKIFAVVVFTVVILALASFKMYYVRDDGGADIVWNKSKGYLFLSVVRRGYHFSYMAYPMVMMLGYFGDFACLTMTIPRSQCSK